MKRRRDTKSALPADAKQGRLVPQPGPGVSLDQLQLRSRPKPGVTTAHLAGTFLVAGLLPNAKVARDWSRSHFGDPDTSIDLTTTYENVVEAAERVNRGDLSHVEAMLTAQMVALNAMFVDLARRAHVTKTLEYEGHYLKLAFKAQSQCRATAKSLAELKNPPVFTRQANIAGQQVVNNGTITQTSRARESGIAPKELLEAHGEPLDGREAGEPDSVALACGGTAPTAVDPPAAVAITQDGGTVTASAGGKLLISGQLLGDCQDLPPRRDLLTPGGVYHFFDGPVCTHLAGDVAGEVWFTESGSILKNGKGVFPVRSKVLT